MVETAPHGPIGWPLLWTLIFSGIFFLFTVPAVETDFSGKSDVVVRQSGGIEINGRSLISTEAGLPVLNAAPFVDSPFTVDIVIEAARFDERYIGSLLTYATVATFNWAIEQHGSSLVALYKGRSVRFTNVVGRQIRSNFVFVFTAIDVTLYRDGSLLGTGTWKGEASDWETNARLTVASLDTGDFPWTGIINSLKIHAQHSTEYSVSLELGILESGALQLEQSHDSPIPLRIYDWPRRIKLQDLFRLNKQIFTAKDILLNIALTLLLGTSLAALVGGPSAQRRLTIVVSVVFTMSLLSESLQFFSPYRVASIVDVAMNSLGAIIGAMMWMKLSTLSISPNP